MNKIISLLIILICSTTYGQKVKDLSSEKFTKVNNMILFKNKPFNGIGVIYQGENQPKTKIQYENGLINGISELYFNNYRLKAQGELVQENRNNAESQKNGLWVFYDNDGSLLGECNYNSNVPVLGFAVEYHENENVKNIVEYSNGRKNGAQKFYNVNGIISSEYHYIDDIQKGIFKEYTDDGKIVWRRGERLDDSNFSYQEFDTQTGILWHYLEFKSGEEETEKMYYSSGQISSETNKTKDGSLVYIKYFESGGIKTKQTDSERIEYHESGQLKLSRSEKENIEIRYFENGIIQEKGQILSNKKNGVWESYNSLGEITSRKYFINDTLNNSVPFENGAPINENYDGYVFDLNWNNYKDLQTQFEKNPTGLYFLNQPLTARITVRHKNRLISRFENYVNGKEEGVFEAYNEEGIPYYKKHYKNGLLHGVEEVYFWDRPILEERRNWKYGELDGIREIFHENGQLMRKSLYEAGKLVEHTEQKSIEEVYWENDTENLSIKYGIYYKNGAPYSGLIMTVNSEGYITEKGDFLDGRLVGYYKDKDPMNPTMQDLYEEGQVYMNNSHRDVDLKNKNTSNENYDSRSKNSQSNNSNCRVDISSESSIQRYLEQGLRTEGGGTITYKVLSDWNTVGLEIRLDNGSVVKGINVRIKPGYTSATISVDLPSIGRAEYNLYSNGELESYDGIFKYKCK